MGSTHVQQSGRISDLPWVKSCFPDTVALDFLMVHPCLVGVGALWRLRVSVVLGAGFTDLI